MGNAAAGLIFMIAMDPLLTVMSALLGIVKLMAYMDDIAAAMTLRGCLWFQLAINSYRRVGPLIIDQHRCWATSECVTVPCAVLDAPATVIISLGAGTAWWPLALALHI